MLYAGRVQKKVKKKVDQIIKKGYKIVIVNEPSHKSRTLKEKLSKTIVEAIITYSVELKQQLKKQA